MNEPRDQRVYLGIDVGTGSARAGIFAGAGELMAATSQDIDIHRHWPFWLRGGRSPTGEAYGESEKDRAGGTIIPSSSSRPFG